MLRVGRQIFVRTTGLYASFLVAASVLARVGDAPLGAHQIAFELYVFVALLLDAVAIAGQVIVGRMLGAGDPVGAHAAARRMIGWSVGLGAVFGVALLALQPWLPRLFTSDAAVLHSADRIWILFAVMQPLAGAVFALDGILIGAGDTSYLMWSTLVASLGIFVPIALASLAFGWGILGVWAGLDALIGARLVFLATRFAGRRWAVVGCDLGGPRQLGLRDDPDVRLRRLPAVRVRLLRLVVGDRARDDHVVAVLPVDRRRRPCAWRSAAASRSRAGPRRSCGRSSSGRRGSA